jgi:predicted SAM-dependent methyltransferase
LDYQQLVERRRERLFGRDRPIKGRGIEFGPLSRPLVRKNDTEVYFIDHCTTDELREKYANVEDAHVDNIQNVDFVSSGQPLTELISEKLPLDFIVASHVIEHVPDLIGWLFEMQNCLRPGGKLYLVIPDKRFTFDVKRRTSSFHEILTAYTEKRTRPGLRLVLDHFANVVNADCYTLWDKPDEAESADYCHGPEYLDIAHQHFHEGKYIDIHCWVFTPESFLKLLEKIVAETSLALKIVEFTETPKYDLEFYVTLQK